VCFEVEADLRFSRISKQDVSQELLAECAELFSAHYGTWSHDHPNSLLRGKPIQLSAERIRTYLTQDGWIAIARGADGELRGYAIAAWMKYRGTTTISWVTQLVVHTEHRRRSIGFRLLTSIWGFSDHFAWGIASASPYAIRTLEKATRRLCLPQEIQKHEAARIKALDTIEYLRGKKVRVSKEQSIIDTEFCQDLAGIAKLLEHDKQPWMLGDLPACHEWLGMTFRSQRQSTWSQSDFLSFIGSSSEIAAQAYDRMSIADPESRHPWASPERAEQEIAFLVDRMKLALGARVLDFGCGSGRHCFALAQRGFEVVGVDRSKVALSRASKKASNLQGVKPRFVDNESLKNERRFDAGLCLFDVIGSYPNDRSNADLLDEFISNVRPGGAIALSVMSFDFIEAKAKYVSNGNAESLIANLPPSKIMESSGEVFDPDALIVDKKLRIVIRKEQFDHGANLPEEIMVADRRYTFADLRELCEPRFAVDTIGYVRAGKFHLIDEAAFEPLKEILVIGRKRLV